MASPAGVLRSQPTPAPTNATAILSSGGRRSTTATRSASAVWSVFCKIWKKLNEEKPFKKVNKRGRKILTTKMSENWIIRKRLNKCIHRKRDIRTRQIENAFTNCKKNNLKSHKVLCKSLN